MGNKNRKASPEPLATGYQPEEAARSARIYSAELARRSGFQGYIGDVEQELVNITLANLEALADGWNVHWKICSGVLRIRSS